MLNDKFSYPNRCLRTQTGKLLFGSVGRRLFVDFLDKAPGFSGRIDFIHKLNLTSLFTVTCNEKIDFVAANAVWQPELMTLSLENETVSFFEQKYITEDDTAVSLQCWKNRGAVPLVLTLEAAPALCEFKNLPQNGVRLITTPKTTHGFRVGIAVASSLKDSVCVLQPGETQELIICAAAGNLETESEDSLCEKALQHMREGSNGLEQHLALSEEFYSGFPQFQSSDALLNATWNYRLFILKHTLAFPDFQNLQGACMYEGRSHKMGREPLNPAGWEFSKLINLSTPLHITDFRWHNNREYLHDIVNNMLGNLDENGIFCSAYVDKRLHAYANYGVWAIWLLWQVEMDADFTREILPKLKKYIANEDKTYGGKDNLQIERQHNRTGKEYQPSYWSFGEYPSDPKSAEGRALVTPLKRVDRSVYHYLNVLGLAKLCAAVGDEDYCMYNEIAAEIKADVLEKMWNPQTEFFYDLHHETDAQSDVKNIVGVYPFWAGITGENHLGGLEKLFDENYFYTGCPFPSVARDSEIYSPMGGWRGNFIKGRDGCVWCGPSWPYTTAIALDAIAIQSKNSDGRYNASFGELLRKYALQHFRDHDLNRPYLVEHYNAETGEPLSDDVDYNHSFFLDLIMKHVAGIEINEGAVSFSPIDIGIDYFTLENVTIGKDVFSVSYRRKGFEANSSIPEGFTVLKNGDIYEC